MNSVRRLAFGILAITGAIHGQNILNQFSIPFNYIFSVPFFEVLQFDAPDGSGGLILFNLADDSLRRFDSTGKLLWNVTFSFGSAQGVVSAMAIAPDGVLLGGQVSGALPGQTSAGASDAFVAKYDLNGNALWTAQFGTVSDDYTTAIVLDPAGFYVLGVTDGLDRLFIRSCDPNGNEIWTRYFNDPSLVGINGGAADPTGIYFFGETSHGYNLVRKFDSSGNDVLTYTLDQAASVTAAAADGQGVYVAYIDGPAQYVTRLDLTGTEVWTKQMIDSNVIGAYVGSSIVADTSGFYFFGAVYGALPGQCYAGDGDIFVMRFDPSANPIWTREFGTANYERPAEVSIANSVVYVSGFTSDNAVSLTTLEKSSSAPQAGQPTIFNECVLNAANFLGGGVAPGEIVTILGSALGPQDLVKLQPSANGQIATALGGMQILFNGEPAPMIYASAGQSSAIVPYDLAGQSTVNVQVQYNGAASKAVTLPIFDTRLGVFSFGPNGTGQAAVINQDGTINSASNPAAPNSFVSIYATGGGLPNPLGADNQLTGAGPSTLEASAYVSLESDGSCCAPSYPATVTYYGGAPESVPGLIQINAQLPADAPAGDAVPLYIGLDTTGTVEQMVTIAVQ